MLPVKHRLDQGLEFLDRCLDEYYKNARTMTGAKKLEELEKAKRFKEELIELEEIDFPRFVELKAQMKQSKEYLGKMKAYVEKNKAALTQFQYLFKEHSHYVRERIVYKFDSELFRAVDFSRSVFGQNTCPSEKETKKAIFEIVREKHVFSGKLYRMMIVFIELMKLTFESTTSMLRVEFHSKLKQRYFQFVNSETLQVDNYYDLGKEDPAQEHTQIADTLRQSEYFKDLYSFNKLDVENTTLFQKPEWNPFFFEEIYKKNAEPESEGLSTTSIMNMVRSSIKKNVRLGNLYNSRVMLQKKQHLVIMVHGYHASHFDMRVYQNFLAKIIPHSIFLISKANEDMTKKRIGQMGRDLAEEIQGYMQQSCLNFWKISFIGHSLGGVIIRAALPHLGQYKPKFFSFVSLSSPHLGCRQNKSSLVNLGMAFMDKFQKDVVISELNMNDHENPRETFMYKLAKNDHLNLFNNVILVSSPQDSYVPYTSARIQPLEPTGDDPTDLAIFQMAKNVWNRVNNDMIVRLDVDLRSEKK